MANPNMGYTVITIWNETLRETEDPYQNSAEWLYRVLGGLKQKTYREHLDRPIINFYGEVVPRIVTVRRNLRMLGNIRLDPKRLV